jgi:L-lactate dehydrogenase complex protein LldE
MHANTGFRGEAFSLAKKLVHLYADSDAVVIPSSSCVAMIRDQYPQLMNELGNQELRREFSALMPRVYELSEFIVDVLGVEDVGAYFPHRVTYHASCHGLRALELGDRPIRLLKNVEGLDLAPLGHLDRCCGFGGTFSVKNAEVSSAMMTAKLQDVMATRAEFCTALDNSCLMHLGGAMHREFAAMRTIHMAQILASTKEHRVEVI